MRARKKGIPKVSGMPSRSDLVSQSAAEFAKALRPEVQIALHRQAQVAADSLQLRKPKVAPLGKWPDDIAVENKVAAVFTLTFRDVPRPAGVGGEELANLCSSRSYVVLGEYRQQYRPFSSRRSFSLLNEQNISLLPLATLSESGSRFEAGDSDAPCR
jgi:hypothetical protein